jgi:molecular chaperone Hsp33
VRSALGVLVQPLPGADLEAFETLRLRVEQPDFRDWLEAAPHELEAVLAHVAPPGSHPRVLHASRPSFTCHCSRDKVTSVLRLFDPAELQDMLDTEGHADVNCHFCAQVYHYSRADLESLLGQGQIGHA